MTFRQLAHKQVIQIENGVCLGKIDDVEFDTESSAIQTLIMLGRPKLFGLLGREPSLLIDWEDVVRFGVDAVLVKTVLPQPPEPRKSAFWQRLGEL